MGRDKGLIEENGITWAERAYNTLATVCDRVVYSINEKQRSVYSAKFANAELIVDTFFDMGPLAGLLSVHQRFPNTDLFLLACDMISITQKHLLPLLELSGHIRAYKRDGYFEPLCTFYSAQACAAIASRVSANAAKTSLQQILREMQVTAIHDGNLEFLISQNVPARP